MKSIFDQVSYDCSKIVTQTYSTSFSLATKMLSASIRSDIYNIYGFVRFADEIVDTFHDYSKTDLFNKFEADFKSAIEFKISLNPILNSFQYTYHKYKIPYHLVNSFMKSMRMDLTKNSYRTTFLIMIFSPCPNATRQWFNHCSLLKGPRIRKF